VDVGALEVLVGLGSAVLVGVPEAVARRVDTVDFVTIVFVDRTRVTMNLTALDVADRSRAAVDVGTLAVLVGPTLAVEVAVLAVLDRMKSAVGGALLIGVGTSGP
jgi:hypothetical protein